MTRMSLAERRQKLIAAALAVIARHGVAAATTRAIAAQAGMPLASFHYAFESHQALMVEAMRALMASELEHRDAVQLDGDDQQSMIAAALGSHLADIQERALQYRSLLELGDYAFRTPGQEHLPAEWREARCRQMTLKVAEHSAARGFALAAGPEAVADAMVTMADGLTQTYLVTRDVHQGELAISCWTQKQAS